MPGTKQYTADEFINAIESYDADLAATGEVASKVGCARETALSRLQEMQKAGEVTGRETPGGYIWEVAE